MVAVLIGEYMNVPIMLAVASLIAGGLVAFTSQFGVRNGADIASFILVDAITLGMLSDGAAKDTAIGIGMWLGAIMWFNVWFVIWPNQQRALGIVEADADSKAASAKTAMLFSRTNTLLSIPMLFAMASAQNIAW